MTVEQRADRFISPGTKVRLDGLWNGVTSTPEYGVVVHYWVSEELGGHHDCFIALFGTEPPPIGQPDDKPYVLRYAATSLVVLDNWP